MTHKAQLLAWFRRGLSITPAEAVNQWNNYRLADTVYQLREDGHNIRTETMERINSEGRRVTYARYHWIAGPKGETPDQAGVMPASKNIEIVSLADRMRALFGKVRGNQ